MSSVAAVLVMMCIECCCNACYGMHQVLLQCLLWCVSSVAAMLVMMCVECCCNACYDVYRVLLQCLL